MAKKINKASVKLVALLENYGKQIDSAIEKNTVHYTTKQIFFQVFFIIYLYYQ